MAEGGDGGRSFTWKAIAFGIAGACAIVAGAAITNLVDINQTLLVGNHLPPAPFAFVLVLALVWNPTIGRIARLNLSTRELAVVLGFTLFCAWIPYSSLYRYLQRSVVMPQIQADTKPDWRKQDTLGHLPRGLFPLGGSAEASALGGAIDAESNRLHGGGLDAELAAAGTDRPGYAAALDLAGLVPPRLWSDPDAQDLARSTAERAWQRASASDVGRWAAAGTLLASMPEDLSAGDGSPPAWRLARTRLGAEVAARLPEAKRQAETVYNGMMQGLAVGDRTVALAEVPAAAWLPTLLYWAPLVIFFTLAVLMLSLVVHRQWSHHEQLTYPIAAVATAVIARPPGRLVGDVLRSRLFWWGFVPVVAVHALNYLSAWFPGRVPWITLSWSNYDALLSVVPGINQCGGAENLQSGAIFFAIVGLSYFIASEVSLSLGLTGFAVVLLGVQWYAATGTTTDLVSARSGAYIGYAGVLLYTGRHYYWAVLQRACGLAGGADGEHREPVWAARLFLIGFAGLVWVLAGAFAIGWPVALAYAMTLMVVFLVITRIVCETGIPFIQAGWQPAQFLANTLGIGALGPGPFVMLCYLGSIITQDPRECLMPFAATSFKLAENTGVRRLRFAVLGFGAIILALVVGLVAVTWGLYNYGSSKDGWAQGTGAASLDEATRGLSTLQATGQYAASAAATGLAKIPLVADNVGKAKELGWTAFGLAAVVGFSLLRFRFPGFILHPVLFLVWGTYPAQRVWFAFLLGWAIKALVVRFGGGRVYQNLKPLFIGLIAGELVAASAIIGIGWLYYLLTGLASRPYQIFPG